MLKFLAFLLMFFGAQPLFGQDAVVEAQIKSASVESVSSKDSYSHENHQLTLEAVLASEQIKSYDKHQVNGLYTSLKTSLLYAMTDKDEFRLYASYVKESYEADEGKNYFELAEFMYRRKAILNYIDHGVNVDFELKHGVVLDTEIKKYWGFSAETIPQIIIKKRLPNAFGIEFKARHHYYQRNRNRPSTITGEDRLYLSAYKMFAEQFIFNTELKYRHKTYTGGHFSHHRGGYQNENHEDLVLHPGLLYFLTRQALVEGYLETKLNDTFDKRSTKVLARDELIIGAALYVTIF